MSPMEVDSVGEAYPASEPSNGAANSASIIKSPQDKKLYRRFTLPNRLEVLLISDPEMSANALMNDAGVDDDETSGSESDGWETDSAEGGAKARSQGDKSDEDDSDGTDEDSESEAGEDEDEGAGAHRHHHGGKGRGVKKAAAAMAVGVGSFCDIDAMPGISHYLEHMLFMGSEKYPDENEYDSYLSEHGGSSNAFTELEFTNYHFECKPDALHGALDRFAQFFIAPLCKADALEREVMAVENEFSGVLQSDSARLGQLRCHTARDGHLYRKFTWGNRKSLFDEPQAKGVDIRSEIVSYYRKQYSAERMNLVILGGESLDTLEEWTRNLFGGVSGGAGPRPVFSEIGPPYQGGRLHILPAVKHVHDLTASFQLPSLYSEYRTKAEEYISHLIGHEGEGSLLSALKRRGWANTLSAGVGEGGYDRNSAAFVFEVNIGLTDLGLDAAPGGGLAVIGLLFDYIALLQRAGPQQWVHDEIAAIADMRFRFAEEEDAIDMVTNLASDMHLHAPEHALVAHYLHERWNPALVEELLGYLTPANLRLDLLTRKWEEAAAGLGWNLVRDTEPWFETPYVAAAIPQETLASWDRPNGPLADDLALPQRNTFLPTDFSLRSNDAAPPASSGQPASAAPVENGSALQGKSAPASGNGVIAEEIVPLTTPPTLLIDSPGLRLWHKMDSTFNIPKASAHFRIASPVAYESAAAAASTDLLVRLLTESLCETAYLADVAGLQYEIWPEGRQGIYFRVEGFNHKLPALTSAIFTRLANFQVCPKDMARLKESLVRKYSNANMKPDRHATYLRLQAIKHSWHIDAVLAELKLLTPEDIEAFLPRLLAKTHVEALLHGNLSAADAETLGREVRQSLGGAPLAADDRPVDDIICLPFGASYLHRAPVKNPDEDNSVAEVYFQVGPDAGPLRAQLDLLEVAMSERCYDVLRTREQLGYAVHCGVRITHSMLGFAFVVVSGTHAPSHLDARINAFLTAFEEQLAAMPSEELDRFRAGAISGKLQADRSLIDESERTWEQIASGRYNFVSREQEAALLGSTSHEDLLDAFRSRLLPSSGTSCRLAVHVLGRRCAAELSSKPPLETALLPDLEAMKRGLETFHAPRVALPPPLLAS